ncbi:IS4 family transposase [Phragmitibacter flavus]|uniref:IS4 family transposase n=1 Tax=Phragmitibacter flavus TaxID=2576071 RepID=A0A5R8K6Z2_9BACT|nr:IS4 family transposase [Phragmitibacter flavus]TLD68154.1 IS4 family transposase [Phragmitibacter flavus]
MSGSDDIEPWAKLEIEQSNCGDARINRRMGKLLSVLGQSPGASIPQACNGQHGDIAAAYRFFDNPAASPENILTAHTLQSLARMGEESTVLLVQDTTEIDLSQPQRRIQGAGPLDASARQGALLHLMHAFSPDGTPLGSVWHKLIIRPERLLPGEKGVRTERQTRAQRQNTPLEQKESIRWIEGLAKAQALALAQPQVRMICIADSEADIYEYLAHQSQHDSPVQAHWIVRACQPRVLLDAEDQNAGTVLEACAQGPVLWNKTVHVRGRQPKLACDKRKRRQPREDRDILVEARAASGLRLRSPYRRGQRLEEVRLNAVLVSEVCPPESDVPVEWLLLTSLPVDTAQQVQQVVEAYTQRFMIEVLFRVLKSGCRIEERRFEKVERHLSHLALALIIAWRVLRLSQMGQHQAQKSAQEVFTTAEWQAGWSRINRGKPLPAQAPSVGEMVHIVGKLGGWIQRGGKSASPPGVQTLWQGLQRLHDLATMWNICHS